MMKFYLQLQPFRSAIDMYIRDDRDGKAYGCTTMVFDKLDEGALSMPCAVLKWDAAQSLIDELWSCGLRPSAGQGSAGQLAAVERHLADMQKLVFKGAK